MQFNKPKFGIVSDGIILNLTEISSITIDADNKFYARKYSVGGSVAKFHAMITRGNC